MENLFIYQPLWESSVEQYCMFQAPMFDLELDSCEGNTEVKIVNGFPQPPFFFPNYVDVPSPSSSDEEAFVPVKQERFAHHEMEKFPEDRVKDFKHVIYNLLVDYYNNPNGNTPNVGLVQPYECEDETGNVRTGFFFDEKMLPEKRLPELYAWHIRKSRLQDQDQECVLIQDLYKFYMRACVELLSKYFEKVDKYTFLDDDPDCPLFVPGGSLLAAEKRIRNMRTRARKSKKGKRSAKRVKLEGGIAKKPRRAKKDD